MAITALSYEEQSEWERDHEILKAYADGQESMNPCEDAISRQAVLNEIPILWNSNGDKDYCMETLRDFVIELSSVSVAEKVGRWIESRVPQSILSECSECGYTCGAVSMNYCPNCGARMREVGEHE